GSISNTASVAVPTGFTDPTPGNNTSSAATTTINRQADLSITKSAAASVIAGQNLTYTITVTNNGPSSILPADQFTVSDALPSGFTATTYTPSSGTYTSGTGAWSGVTMATGQSVTLTIVGTVNGSATGSLSNTASVTAPAGVTDPVGTNNTSSAATTTIQRQADLSITKTAPANAVAGGNLTYTITITNNGPSSIINTDQFTVSDALPANFTATTYTPSSGSYTSGTGAWTGVTMATGQTVTLTIAGTVSPSATGSLSNTASVTAPAGVTDPTPANNTSTPAVTALDNLADLSITKSAAASVVAGQNLTYTITVTNNGPSTISTSDQFKVTDVLPTAYTATTFTPSSGTYTPATGNWT
ncbi:MAG: DUF11 domain-containing protein, partial [Flavipsychrobacter sp.]|nr:DUF11 domain-containing protein [Flavipsychrobacter sp.]